MATIARKKAGRTGNARGTRTNGKAPRKLFTTAGAQDRDVLFLDIHPRAAQRIAARLGALLEGARFLPDVHAREMMLGAGKVLLAELPARDVEALARFGTGAGAPVLFVRGLPE